MLQNVIQNISANIAEKIIRNSMSDYLQIENIDDEVKRKVDKNKKYLLYIHIPFCHTFCPFCSFHKFIYNENAATKYFAVLREELRKVHDEGFEFDSLYVGGGTTLINEKELITTLELIKELFDINEISCESDPNHLNPDSLKQFSGLIDRLSIGVQSFDDTILKKVHRYEKFGSGKEVEKKLKAMGDFLPNTNIDLIFNFPEQTKQSLRRDLQIAKEVGVSQITTYPLMNSGLTEHSMQLAFGAQHNNKEYDFYKIIREEFSEYELNNAWSFSKHHTNFNDEYVGSHDEYVGVGSGAFSFLNGHLYINAFDLKTYSELVAKRPHAIIAQSTFGKKEQIKYHFLTALFNGKINIKTFNEAFETDMKKSFAKELFALKQVGAIKIVDDMLVNTPFGDYLAVCMMKSFYSGMDKVRALFRSKLVL